MIHVSRCEILGNITENKKKCQMRKKNKEKKQHVARCLSDKNNLITFKLRFPFRKQGESTPQENWNAQEIYKSQFGKSDAKFSSYSF